MEEKFASVRKYNIFLKHCVGIDYGSAVAVRAGIRNDNDLIWIGVAPSLAAKLSDIRDYPYEIYITERVFDKIAEYEEQGVWELVSLTIGGSIIAGYRCKTLKEP